MSFEIPSPYVAGIESPPPSNMSSKTSSTSSTFLYYTSSTGSLAIPPNGVFKVRRQSPLAQASKRNASALLPPPTRPQKFVQMKLRRQREETANKGRRSSTRVADRKITKNKAHSVVEHRRRVKMNEAFAVMKGLIPACTGEMHKLDILQASIDYVHYLEDCVAKLQAKDSDTGATSRSEQTTSLPLAFSEPSSHSRQDPIYHEDVETSDPERLCSSASTDNNGCDFTNPLCTPPTPHPETYSSTRPTPVLGISAFSSALPSQTDLDQEANGSLLMLDIDRQSDNSSVLRRGVSIRDLLA